MQPPGALGSLDRVARGRGGGAVRAASKADLDRLCVDTLRALAMDAVQLANSGHPGMPMAMAPVAYVLYARVMRHDPREPRWPDRDRFVLSAGHGSMLLYGALHLAGYDVSRDDLRCFRQWGSKTPGHPEHDQGRGVETTTGPLGQGFANGVGMAMAERFLRERYGPEVVDHRVFALCSDGDLMEGVAAEAASLAGHLGLGRLVYVWDDNAITIDGSTELAFDGEDVAGRFRALGWQVLDVADVNDLALLEAALREGCAEEQRPTLVRARSTIAYGAPTKAGTPGAHGAPLGDEEVRAAKEALDLDPERSFFVPDEVYAQFEVAPRRGRSARAAWEHRLDRWREREPDRAAEWDRAWGGRPGPGLAGALPRFDPADPASLATRSAGGKAMAAFAPYVPTMMGGSADLAESTKTAFPGEPSFSRAAAGRNVHWGVREHAMGAAVNGLALHGGVLRPYGSTFLVFSDCMRPAIRLSALMGLDVAWVFSHDSVGLGEDGPTHQPIEHLAALRAIPGLTVIRPADAAETVEAWRVILEELRGPACLVLTRQDVPVLERDGVPPVARGAYVLAGEADPDVVLMATGSEVSTAMAAREALAGDGVEARVVSMPSWELFALRTDTERDAVLPPGVPRVAVEAGSSMGWERWGAGRCVTLDRFGASAPGAEVLARLGITPGAVAAAERELLA